MLAKIWKKFLLAICIIAMLFDITVKLVNRISLEKAISSSPEGVNMREILNITEEHRAASKSEDSVSRYKTLEEVEAERAEKEAEEQRRLEQESQETYYTESQYNGEQYNNAEDDEQYYEQTTDEQEVEEKQGAGSRIIDKITESINDTKKYNDILN